MPYRTKCVKCPKDSAKDAALKWTLFNGQVSVIAPLCVEHMAPLTELVNILGPRPLLQTGAMEIVPTRKVKVSPIEGWVKPE
jgi:hypothetical protein